MGGCSWREKGQDRNLGIDKPAGTGDDDAWASDKDLYDLDVWMARHSKPIAGGAVTWSLPPDNVVRDGGHLAELISMLEAGGLGVAQRGSRWAKAVHIAGDGEPAAYIVEVHVGEATDFSQRVFRGLRSSDYPQRPVGAGRFHDVEVFDATTSASIVWSFLHVGLPVGYISRRLDEV